MWDRSPASLELVHMLPVVAERYGLAVAPLLARGGIGANGDGMPDGVVARAQICTVLEHLARRTGEGTIGLELAASADPLRLGISGRALLSGRTLRECLDAHRRHMPTLQAGVLLSLEMHGDRAVWRNRFEGSDPDHARVLGEGVAGFMAAALRRIGGPDAAPLVASFPHRARAPIRVYEEYLGAPVAFGSDEGLSIEFDAGLLDRPNLLRQGARAAPAVEVASILTGLPGDDDLIASISRVFEAASLSGVLSLVDTARSLGRSPRGLQRRLAVLGTSFEAELDAWRRATARRYLAETPLPIGQVARAVGYADAAHFVRAFRRWDAMTPQQFRRQSARDAA